MQEAGEGKDFDVLSPPPPIDGGWDLVTSQDYCTHLAENHYENFPVGSRWIRPELRKDMHAIYAFSRTADDFADEEAHDGHRLKRLQLWRQLLFDAAEGKADHPIFVALSETIRKHRVPIDLLEHLIRAFEWDVLKNRHESFDSIVQYARFSANPVGRLVLWIHGYRERELFEFSDAICSALQFANFWQDVWVDWAKDRIYLPQDDMNEVGYTEEDLQNGIVNEEFCQLLERQVQRTWRLFFQGRPLCDRVGKDLRIELRLVWCGGTRILERIEKSHFDVYRRRPKLNLSDKGLMLWRAFRWAKSAKTQKRVAA